MSRFSQTTPGTYSIRVPYGTTRIIVDVAGSEASAATTTGAGTNGTTGKGGRVQGVFRVRSGEQLTIAVPAQGGGQAGGSDLAAELAGNGGDKATITGSLSGPLVIAGGGGGGGGRGGSAGNGGNGGDGGGTTAVNGTAGTGGSLGNAGQAATGAANGAGGTGGAGPDGTAGGAGGAGGVGNAGPGGGGGNGFFNGGGGEGGNTASSGGGGGGGGSSFTHATQAVSATHTQGFQSGAGYVVLDFLDYASYTDRYRFLR